MCVCVCVYIYIYMYIYICVCVCVCVCGGLGGDLEEMPRGRPPSDVHRRGYAIGAPAYI